MLSQAKTIQTTAKFPETTKEIPQKDKGVSPRRYGEQRRLCLQSVRQRLRGRGQTLEALKKKKKKERT